MNTGDEKDVTVLSKSIVGKPSDRLVVFGYGRSKRQCMTEIGNTGRRMQSLQSVRVCQSRSVSCRNQSSHGLGLVRRGGHKLNAVANNPVTHRRPEYDRLCIRPNLPHTKVLFGWCVMSLEAPRSTGTSL